jgi:antitoxin component YwqK of YwqJK toxin-antitoxin module
MNIRDDTLYNVKAASGTDPIIRPSVLSDIGSETINVSPLSGTVFSGFPVTVRKRKNMDEKHFRRKLPVLSTAGLILFVILGCGTHELRETRYPGGQLRDRCFLKKDRNGNQIQDGMFTAWYANGRKKEEVPYKNGKKFGIAVCWYDNGNKMHEVTFMDGKENSVATTWYINGKKMQEVLYKNGIEQGMLNGWYENGQKKEEIPFKDGRKNGTAVFWFEDGRKKQEVIFMDGKETGIDTVRHVSERKNKILPDKFVEKKTEVVREKIDPDRNAKKDGENGVVTLRYANGRKKSEQTYKGGKLNGIATTWYENGQKKAEVNFVEGEPSGTFISWYDNGQKEQEINYKNGKKNGLKTVWNKNGKTIKEYMYNDGELSEK